MTIEQFWNIINDLNQKANGDMERKCELLKLKLKTLTSDEILLFLNHFNTLKIKSYTWELWGAAYIIGGGCSDDAFNDFRSTLISMGKEVFEKALIDPESLVELDIEDGENFMFEGFEYPIYESMTGDISENTISYPANPLGEEWDEDQIDEKFPKLSERYN